MGVALCRSRVSQQRGEVKVDALDEKVVTSCDVRQHEVAAVGGEGELDFPGADRTGRRLELAVEEFVEGGEGVRRSGEFARVHPVGLQKRGDLCPAGRGVHAAAVPARKSGAFHQCMQGRAAERALIGEAQKALSIHGFGLDPLREAVEKSDRFGRHAGPPLASSQENATRTTLATKPIPRIVAPPDRSHD